MKNKKSKLVAYFLLVLFGWCGLHHFYLGKVGTGIVYIFTGAVGGLGLIWDLFALSSMVDKFNKEALEEAKTIAALTNPTPQNIITQQNAGAVDAPVASVPVEKESN